MELTFIGKPDCHLCEDAREQINAVLASLPQDAPPVTVRELSILDDPELFERYVEEIPVVLLDGVVHAIWRVREDRLRDAILRHG